MTLRLCTRGRGLFQEHHPLDQPVPGQAGRVPSDWEDHLN